MKYRINLIGTTLLFAIVLFYGMASAASLGEQQAQAASTPAATSFENRIFIPIVRGAKNTVDPTPVPTPSTVDCPSLAATWTGGKAEYITERGVYDVSDCTRATASSISELVKPAIRDPQKWSQARCNDGTPFSLQVQLSPYGDSKEWVIFLQGGAFCDDNLASCADRSKNLTTSFPGDDRDLTGLAGGGGLFNRSQSKNPALYDANYVVAMYCSSDIWSGATTTRRPTTGSSQGWYFSGKSNVEAAFEILAERYGLDDTDPGTKVMFAGESAGGAGVQVNADIAAENMPVTARDGRLMLVNDGGFMIHYDNPDYRPVGGSGSFEEMMAHSYEFWAAEAIQACEQDQFAAGRHPAVCFFSAVNYPYIVHAQPDGLGLPILQSTSSIDSYYLQVFGIDANNPADRSALEDWRAAVLDALDGMAWVFSGGDHTYHTLLTKDDYWSYGPAGRTFREVISRFWQGVDSERVVFGNP